MPVPPDPRRVEHDKLYAQLFSRLRENLPMEFNVKAIPNGYFDDKFNVEPWYSLSFAGWFEIVVGARKRVIEVTLKTSQERLDTRLIASIGKRDGVTFSTNSSGGMLHAWGTEKAFEYVRELYRTATEK